jgi:hypothetical protein
MLIRLLAGHDMAQSWTQTHLQPTELTDNHNNIKLLLEVEHVYVLQHCGSAIQAHVNAPRTQSKTPVTTTQPNSTLKLSMSMSCSTTRSW